MRHCLQAVLIMSFVLSSPASTLSGLNCQIEGETNIGTSYHILIWLSLSLELVPVVLSDPWLYAGSQTGRKGLHKKDQICSDKLP